MTKIDLFHLKHYSSNEVRNGFKKVMGKPLTKINTIESRLCSYRKIYTHSAQILNWQKFSANVVFLANALIGN